MRRLLVWYGLAMTSIVLVAFLVPLGLLARSLAQDRALSAGRQDAQRVVPCQHRANDPLLKRPKLRVAKMGL